jgi:hypothetical protein
MKGKLMALCVLTLVMIPVSSSQGIEMEAAEGNLNTPLISGPKIGIMGETYAYKVIYTDPQGDDVYYKIFWGDCSVIYHNGPHKSGEEVTYSHGWCDICAGAGKFTICVQTSDENGEKSNWGTLEVYMKSEQNSGTITSLLIHIYQIIIERFPIFQQILALIG